MSARGAPQAFIVVLLAVVCVGFIAVVGMSAAATPADDGGDHGDDSTDSDRPTDADRDRRGPSDDRSTTESEFGVRRQSCEHDDSRTEKEAFDDRRQSGDDGSRRTHVDVSATQDRLSVAVGGTEPVDVAIEAVEGSYDGSGRYVLDPGDSVELPAPAEPSRIRVLAESDDASLAVILTFERYEFDCGEVDASHVGPGTATYEWAAGDESGSRTVGFGRPPFECPIPDDAPDPGGDTEPPGDPEAAYNATTEAVWDASADGNDRFWTAYEALRQALWQGYEDGHSGVWSAYEAATAEGDDGDTGTDPEVVSTRPATSANASATTPGWAPNARHGCPERCRTRRRRHQ
jgi:hypothetical protein